MLVEILWVTMPHGDEFLLTVQLPALGASGAQSEHCTGLRKPPMAIQIWLQQSLAQGMPLRCLQQSKLAAGATSQMSPSLTPLGKLLHPLHALL
jgi:hypothetical protein